MLTDRGRSQLLGLEQMSLILPNLLGPPELVRWLVKILRKIADDANVGFCGTIGIVTSLEFLQHHSAKMGHRDLLVTHNLSPQSGNYISVHLTRSVRRASGFVQIPITLITEL